MLSAANCGEPYLGNATSSYDHTLAGGTSTFTCNDGYGFEGGLHTVNSSCKSNGQWSEITEQCKGNTKFSYVYDDFTEGKIPCIHEYKQCDDHL